MAILCSSYSPPDGTPVIGVSHPGHIGDCLWAVPAARELAQRHGCMADFWTSRVCEPAADLLQAQEFVRNVVCDPNQRVEGGGGGVQPWHMSNMDGEGHGYRACYHFGFRGAISVPIPEWCCTLYGLPQLPNRYDLPPGYRGRELPDALFVCMASKGEGFKPALREFVRRCPHPVVEVGGLGQCIASDLGSTDRTSPGFLEMAWVISRCRWFVGQLSSPLVVASGFPCVKVCVYRPGQGDLAHSIRTPLHHYVHVEDDPRAILEIIR